MQTQYKHIEFEFIEECGCWYCYNKKGEDVGLICYDDEWKCWGWEQAPAARCSMSCLEDIIAFTKQL